MSEQKEAATISGSDGTITKPFLIDGGRFLIEVNITDGLENIAFSLRGVVSSKNLPDVFQTGENFLKQIINGSGDSDNC